jgi:hypothetical protein
MFVIRRLIIELVRRLFIDPFGPSLCHLFRRLLINFKPFFVCLVAFRALPISS